MSNTEHVRSARSPPTRPVAWTSPIDAMLKTQSGTKPGLVTQLSKMKNMVETKMMKEKMVSDKLSEENAKLSTRVESLLAENLSYKKQLQNIRDRSAEADLLQSRNQELAYQLEEMEHQFSRALKVVEEVRRRDQVRTISRENQRAREVELDSMISELEVQRLKVQFAAIVQEFKGEAQYKAREVVDQDKIMLVEENIKLRQNLHELQAKSVEDGHKLRMLESKLADCYKTISNMSLSSSFQVSKPVPETSPTPRGGDKPSLIGGISSVIGSRKSSKQSLAVGEQLGTHDSQSLIGFLDIRSKTLGNGTLEGEKDTIFSRRRASREATSRDGTDRYMLNALQSHDEGKNRNSNLILASTLSPSSNNKYTSLAWTSNESHALVKSPPAQRNPKRTLKFF